MTIDRSYIIIALLCTAIGCANKQPTGAMELPPDHPALGQWILKAYRDNLLASKSPHAASEFLSGITEFSVSRDSINWVFGNSESKTTPINHLSSDHLVSNDFLLYWNVNQGFLDVKLKKEMLQYAKSPMSQGGFTGLEQLAINHLIAGEYHTWPDNAPVVIGTDGAVQGISGFERIKPLLSTEGLGDFDMVQITDNKGNTRYKAWVIDGDMLLLYHLIPGQDYVYAIGREWLRLEMQGAMG